MAGKVSKNRRYPGVLRQSLSVCLLAGGILAVLLSGVWALEVQAQDEDPICPPGFEWQRMSGVGCVQVDCYEAGGRLSYTSACICNEGMKPCSEPVDYTNFDGDSCGIHCPGSRLVACVAQDQLCPGEAPPEPVITEPPMEWEAPPFGGSETMQRVEDFITGGDRRPPTPGRAAAAAIAGSVMLGIWSLIQNLGQQPTSVIKSGVSRTGQSVPKQGVDIAEPPDLRETAGGLVTDAAVVIDKWPKGGKGDDDATIRRPVESDPGKAVFYGEEARLILIEMGKLPAGTAQSEKLLFGQGGFEAFRGTHPDGKSQPVRLPSGREIVVAEVVAVGYQGGAPEEHGSVEIDFSRKLMLTARLAGELADDHLEAPTMRVPAVDISDAPTVKRQKVDEDQTEEDGEGQS